MNVSPNLLTTALFSIALSAHGGIISVSVPQASQDFGNNDSYPARDNLWTVSVPPYPFPTDLGIGHILDRSASVLAADISPLTRLGVLHSHQYSEPYVPVTSTVVTYLFDELTTVDSLQILQHTNGVTRVEGFVGNAFGSLISIGNIFGTAGDVRGTELFTEGESHVFDFNNSIPGTIFQFRITQTSLANGYALHRAFPIDATGALIDPVPEPSVPALLISVTIGSFLRRRRGR